MKIFISWSGELSKRVAGLLRDWIPNVLQTVEPWMSAEDIEKGEIWSGALSTKLAELKMGLTCLTRDNLSAPWILFEAGALSKGLTKSRVCTLLIDLEPTDVTQPLAQFQATRLVKEDMLRLTQDINAANEGGKMPEERIRIAFEKWWGDFEAKLAQIRREVQSAKPPAKRSTQEMTEELLELTRAVHGMMQREQADPQPKQPAPIKDYNDDQPSWPRSRFLGGHPHPPPA